MGVRIVLVGRSRCVCMVITVIEKIYVASFYALFLDVVSVREKTRQNLCTALNAQFIRHFSLPVFFC
jgi:hypothetical protein